MPGKLKQCRTTGAFAAEVERLRMVDLQFRRLTREHARIATELAATKRQAARLEAECLDLRRARFRAIAKQKSTEIER